MTFLSRTINYHIAWIVEEWFQEQTYLIVLSLQLIFPDINLNEDLDVLEKQVFSAEPASCNLLHMLLTYLNQWRILKIL